jgi:acetyl esterase
MARILEIAAGFAAGLPDRRTAPLDEARRAFALQRGPWNADPPPLHLVAEHALARPGGREVALRLYRPGSAPRRPVILYCHGGGWMFGSNDTHDRIMRLLALGSGAAVVGVEYGLSPELRWPGARDDLLAAWDWLPGAPADWDLDPSRVALAGDSAGAHVALSAALARRDAGEAPARALALFYGVFGADLGTDSYLAFGDGRYGLPRAQMEHYWRSFLGTAPEPGVAADLVSARLDGLPPVHLAAAGLDVLRDDTLRLAAALRAADVPHSLRVWGGVVHSFLLYSARLPQAREAIADAARFLADRLR